MNQKVTSAKAIDRLSKNAKDFWIFIKKPKLPVDGPTGYAREHLPDIASLFVINFAIILTTVLIIIPLSQGNKVPESLLVKEFLEGSLPAFILMAIVTAPLIEEVMMRSWINGIVKHPPIWFQKIFPIVYFGQAITFSALHLANYEKGQMFTLMAMVAPQFFYGLVWGYARIRYGWWSNLLLHVVHNCMLVSVMVLATR